MQGSKRTLLIYTHLVGYVWQAARSGGAEAPWINLALRWLLSGNPKAKATG